MYRGVSFYRFAAPRHNFCRFVSFITPLNLSAPTFVDLYPSSHRVTLSLIFDKENIDVSGLGFLYIKFYCLAKCSFILWWTVNWCSNFSWTLFLLALSSSAEHIVCWVSATILWERFLHKNRCWRRVSNFLQILEMGMQCIWYHGTLFLFSVSACWSYNRYL